MEKAVSRYYDQLKRLEIQKANERADFEQRIKAENELETSERQKRAEIN
jgi:hypothetical protein